MKLLKKKQMKKKLAGWFLLNNFYLVASLLAPGTQEEIQGHLIGFAIFTFWLILIDESFQQLFKK